MEALTPVSYGHNYLSESAKYQVRRIWNIDIFYSDLNCLTESSHKVPGTIIDAYGAILLELKEGSIDYAILSSYLGVIVPSIQPGSSKQSGNGSLEDNIHAFLLISVVNAILTYLKAPGITSQWKKVLVSPLQPHHQFDNWSCGLFTMMAMQNYINGHELHLIQVMLFTIFCEISHNKGSKTDSGDEPEITGVTEMKVSTPIDGAGLTESSHARKRTRAEWRKGLEDDDYCTDVEPNQVWCKGCHCIIKLHSDRKQEYCDTDWKKHKQRCPQITGEVNRHVCIVPPNTNKEPLQHTKLTQFFPLGKKSEPAQPSVPSLPANDRKTYHIIQTKVTPPITKFFPQTDLSSKKKEHEIASLGISAIKQLSAPPATCVGIHGKDVEEYIMTTQTCSLGGISMDLHGQVKRDLFPYKPFVTLKEQTHGAAYLESCHVKAATDLQLVNEFTPEEKWTDAEKQIFDQTLKGACQEIENDAAFKKAIYRKALLAKLPAEEQHEKHVAHGKYTPHHLISADVRALNDKLRDPVVFDVYAQLERGNDSTSCFLALYKAARNGKLANHQTFLDLCTVFEDHIRRLSDESGNLKCGIRYPQNYINFMILLCGHGVRGAFHLNTMDTQGPFLLLLTVQNNHILGSVLPLHECAVNDVEDISAIIKEIMELNAMASQVHAMLLKPAIPQCPPCVVALLPTNGKDNAKKIYDLQHTLLKMAASMKLPIITMAADGAASELCAQAMMDFCQTQQDPLFYEYPQYGIHLHAPVFMVTGLLISIMDPPHACKTSHNQPQHGTHTASLGIGFLVNWSLIDLCNSVGSGLVKQDVVNVDKQDDGAARHLYTHQALYAATEGAGSQGEHCICPGFEGLFVWLFVFGVSCYTAFFQYLLLIKVDARKPI
ncbi:hypothetical protein EDC04DRAFT_2609818 [Pisolithus marmoratus]|nr:hypothetical protein EDC04DRAFT_2609818 [Pisolithus marmoratus]